MPEVELPNPEELEEAKGKTFTRRVALTTAVFAVLLAISSLGGNNAMKEMLLASQQATDQWAYYQSKVIREHSYRTQKLLLEGQLLERGDTMKPKVRAHFESLLKKMQEEEVRFNTEKKEIEQEARKLEKERDVNRSKDPYFDFAEVLLQISIVMASVAILSGFRPIYYGSIVAAILGTLLMLNGFTLAVHLPFFH